MEFRVDDGKDKIGKGVVRFTLSERGDEIVLRAQKEDGRLWNVITILKNGLLRKMSDIGNNVGLELDESGRIVTAEY